MGAGTRQSVLIPLAQVWVQREAQRQRPTAAVTTLDMAALPATSFWFLWSVGRGLARTAQMPGAQEEGRFLSLAVFRFQVRVLSKPMEGGPLSTWQRRVKRRGGRRDSLGRPSGHVERRLERQLR